MAKSCSKKVFYVLIQGVAKRLLIIKRNYSGQIILDLFSEYVVGQHEKTEKIIIRRYVISAPKKTPQAHMISHYSHSGNQRPEFHSYFEISKNWHQFYAYFLRAIHKSVSWLRSGGA